MKLKSPASDSLGEGQRNAQSTLGNEYNLSNQSQEQGGDKTEKLTSPFLAADLVGESKDERGCGPSTWAGGKCQEDDEIQEKSSADVVAGMESPDVEQTE